jgi:glyoxylase-like metal-dependent hydrolase (beta-lactamase superfamily II)/rhodanese-related sulfurtransferase
MAFVDATRTSAMTSLQADPSADRTVGKLTVLAIAHPQGCRAYLLADPVSKQALALDVHLDLVEDVAARVAERGWTLPYVVDSHTHADHPSGSAAIAERLGSTRIAHEKSGHVGVSRHPADGDALHLGDVPVTVLHAPGHTPDHIVLRTAAAVFSGDTLLIGAVARTDFLGGDAGQLFDSLRRVFDELPDETLLFPGHDYAGRMQSTLGDERRDNPWLRKTDRDTFVRELTANKPPRPANMDDLLRLNREGVDIPDSIPAVEATELVRKGAATSVIDVRTGVEFAGESVAGSRLVPMDQLQQRLDEIRATPAPRLLMCRSGARAEMARQLLQKNHVRGLSVIEGGIEAFRSAGGETRKGKAVMSLERQVRIAAGLLVLTGVLLGFFVHRGLFGLSAFVGAGLTFAGITDWCGMGLLLAKAPWNRAAPEAAGGPASACSAGAPSACSAGEPGQS